MPELPAREPEPPPRPIVRKPAAPMVYKTHSEPPPVDASAAWSEHVKQQISAMLGAFAEMLGEEAGKNDKALRSEIADLRTQLKALSDEVAATKITKLNRHAG